MERFEDERGTIEDIIGPVDSVTRILTKKDAVRGNHFHRHSTQWTYVVSGRLLFFNGQEVFYANPDSLVETPPRKVHAWKALEDTVCLAFASGPRGVDYESDTERLGEPLI
jgi:quercetin dioxygenase-like cupin family protein